jgi:hypothetical protein
MSKCEDIQKELDAFKSEEVEEPKKTEIQSHLDGCQECTEALKELDGLSKVLHSWKEIKPSPLMYKKLKERMGTLGSPWRKVFAYTFSRKAALRFAQGAAIVVLTLLISNWLQKPGPGIIEDSAAINFYFSEHQGASFESVAAEIEARPGSQIRMERDDLVYFEYLDGPPWGSHAGFIIKEKPDRQVVSLPRAPLISKGKILEIHEVQGAVDFTPVVPEKLLSGYMLDSVRKIEGRNSLHLLYRKDVDTLSVFQQPFMTEEGLAPQDFRDYAVFQNVESAAVPQEQGKETILTWRNGSLSFVMIGKVDISQLMDVVRSFNSSDQEFTKNMNSQLRPYYY